MPEHDGRGARYTIMSTRPHKEMPNLVQDALGAILDDFQVSWTHQVIGKPFSCIFLFDIFSRYSSDEQVPPGKLRQGATTCARKWHQTFGKYFYRRFR